MLKIKKWKIVGFIKQKEKKKRNFNGVMTEIIYQIYQIYVMHFFINSLKMCIVLKVRSEMLNTR